MLISAGPRNSLKNLLKAETMQEELETMQASKLSAWEFVVYQYGLSVLHLLVPQLQVRLFLEISPEAMEVKVARRRLSNEFSPGRNSCSKNRLLKAAHGSYVSNLKLKLLNDINHVQKMNQRLSRCQKRLIIFMR